jgi:hypothetical protein
MNDKVCLLNKSISETKTLDFSFIDFYVSYNNGECGRLVVIIIIIIIIIIICL